jgi:hypothetical protein
MTCLLKLLSYQEIIPSFRGTLPYKDDTTVDNKNEQIMTRKKCPQMVTRVNNFNYTRYYYHMIVLSETTVLKYSTLSSMQIFLIVRVRHPRTKHIFSNVIISCYNLMLPAELICCSDVTNSVTSHFIIFYCTFISGDKILRER